MTIVFEVLYARIDRLAWDLARVYSQEEEVRNILRQVRLESNAYLDSENLEIGISSGIGSRCPGLCGVAHAVKISNLPFGSDRSCESDTGHYEISS
jgi:hypothetical protein